MLDPEVIRIIKKTIRDELGKILMGTVVENQNQLTVTARRFNSDAPMPDLRRIQPFGVSSRAPVGTPTLIVPIDNNTSHLNTIGEHDPARPSLNDGETILYDAYGHIVYLSQTKMQFGSKGSAENMVLGQIFKTFAHNLLQTIQQETHIGNLGYPTSVPYNNPDYANLQASPIDDSAILSDKAFTEK